jgi:hypothetical protein
MQILKIVWDFIQNQILGMKWLNGLIESGLAALGLDAGNRWVGSLQFFVYDVIKITILLFFLIFVSAISKATFRLNAAKKYWGASAGYGQTA